MNAETEAEAKHLDIESNKLLAKLCAMTPVTLEGCAALLRYVEEYAPRYEHGQLFEDYYNGVNESARDLLSRIAGMLERARRQP